MIALPLVADKPVVVQSIPCSPTLPPPRITTARWASPPWDRDHPAWIALDVDLDPDHLARLIDLLADLLDLQPLFDTYAGRGSPPCPPRLLVKLVLYQYARKRTSPELWLQDVKESKPVAWLLFGLQPARSTLYDFRDRAAPLLDGWNRQILQTAIAEGYTTATAAALDGSFLRARASRHHLLGQTALRRRCQLLEEAVAEDDFVPACRVRTSPLTVWCILLTVALCTLPALTEACPGERISRAQWIRLLIPPRCYPRWMAGTPQGRREQLRGMRRGLRRWQAKNKQHQAKQSQRAKKRRRSSDRVVICVSEPEAALGRDKRKTFCPLYNTQLCRDLDSPFILGYGTFTAVNDSNLLQVMLQRYERLVGWMPTELDVDGAYPSGLALAYCDKNGVRVYAPVGGDATRKGSKGSTPGGTAAKQYGKEKFRYDAQRDVYVCPAGQVLKKGHKRRRQRGCKQQVEMVEYRAEPGACSACPQRAACTKGGKGRTVVRSEYEGLVEQLQQRMATPVGKSTYRLRKQTVEQAIAQVKKILHGDEPLSSYGKPRARTQVGLAVLVLNSLQLFKARQRAGVPLDAPLAPA
jgi:transposase